MSEEKPDFTMSDLLQELAEEFGAPAAAGQVEDGLYTTGEIAELFGVSKSKALREVKKLYGEGRIVVSSKMIDRFGGGEVRVPAYKIKQEKTNGEQD